MSDMAKVLMEMLNKMAKEKPSFELPGEKVVERFATHEIVVDEHGHKRERKVFKQLEVVHKGNELILPEGMEISQAIPWLLDLLAEQNEMTQPDIRIKCFPFDGLIALRDAIVEVFGFSKVDPIRTWFGPVPPTVLSIPTSPTETTEVVMGEIKIPGIHGHIQVVPSTTQNKPCLLITGEVRKKDFPKVKMLSEVTRRIISERSIYRGKAIQLGLRPEERNVNPKTGGKETSKESVHNHPPVFLSVPDVHKDNLILPKRIQAQVNAYLLAPIEKTAVCRARGIPLKRGILLSGPYGTGKTLTASLTMRTAVDNGWTFISLADADMLSLAIDIASWYQPCVIFVEDIDSVLGTQDRGPDINAILNVIDGIDKSREIMVVTTTNHADEINKAMLRPGRIDAIVQFTAPDADAAERLMRLYGGEMIAADENIAAAAKTLEGAPAAMVRECVERAKLAQIDLTGDATTLSGESLAIAADNLADHRRMLEGKTEEDSLTPALKDLGEALGKGIATGLTVERLESIKSAAVEVLGTPANTNGDRMTAKV